MDVASLASFSTQLSQAQLQQQVQISTLKSAQDMAAASVLQLLDSVATSSPVTATSANPNLGGQIDIRV
ncbi:putative motility protein [Marinobacter sp. SS21]|uniref:putative motility protein n=1 Tax=Marinobacter sp. SS21 TaxID=2979460 RepID=UPI00232DDADC|nr:putative motility protein [Marinobacter sp. SS21]MDC0661007.1 putative motility protein [Marinobacter sp. SS21]